VQPPRCEKPVKLSVRLAGKWLFIPSSWHMETVYSAGCVNGPDESDGMCICLCARL